MNAFNILVTASLPGIKRVFDDGYPEETDELVASFNDPRCTCNGQMYNNATGHKRGVPFIYDACPLYAERMEAN